jgi:hypothetical protein
MMEYDADAGLRLVFVNRIGSDLKGKFEYEFIFAADIDRVWGEGWSTVPSGICSRHDKMPVESTYDYVFRVSGRIKLDVAQDNTCFSMQDCIDGVVALAWENINDYENYPEYRMIFRYGENIEVTEKKIGAIGSLYG